MTVYVYIYIYIYIQQLFSLSTWAVTNSTISYLSSSNGAVRIVYHHFATWLPVHLPTGRKEKSTHLSYPFLMVAFASSSYCFNRSLRENIRHGVLSHGRSSRQRHLVNRIYPYDSLVTASDKIQTISRCCVHECIYHYSLMVPGVIPPN